jgi:hypothetical protein
VDLHKITKAWNECTVTWNGAPADSALACGSTMACSTPGAATLSCDPLLPVVQGWVADPAVNNGLALHPAAGEVGAIQLRSRRFGGNPPRLRIWFTCP